MEQTAQKSGIHRVTLHRWEKGQAQPRLPELNAMLEVLEASATQRMHAVALMDAPRAQALMRVQIASIAEQSGMASMPHGGDLLHAMRLRRGWSLEEIATRIGMSSWTLRRWEKAETWPSIEQLHRLCYALQAKEEELIALTCGQFSRLATTAKKTVQELEERVHQFKQSLNDPPFDLKDLELLTLRAEAWTWAARSRAGMRLLTDVYALNYCNLSYQDRTAEAVAIAEKYFDLMPKKTPDFRAELVWQMIWIGAAAERLYATKRTTPKQCIRELKLVLPFTRGTRNEPDALSQISEMLLLQGDHEEALQVAAEAYQSAARNMGDEGGAWFRGKMGVQLIRVGRFAEGLPLLSTGSPGDWYRLVETSLWKVEAFLGLGETKDAEYWLAQAQSELTTYDIRPLQPRLDALKAQIYRERTPDSIPL
jgi:transcriptional regulator with XRE-family HTH domain